MAGQKIVFAIGLLLVTFLAVVTILFANLAHSGHSPQYWWCVDHSDLSKAACAELHP